MSLKNMATREPSEQKQRVNSPPETRLSRGRVIQVENVARSITKETLLNFFEVERRSGGGDVEQVIMSHKLGLAWVTFASTEVAVRVLHGDTFTVNQYPLKVSPVTVVVVQKVRPQDVQDVEGYFRSAPHGFGTDVKSMHYELETQILFVCFKDATVVSSVLSQEHVIGGEALLVTLPTDIPEDDEHDGLVNTGTAGPAEEAEQYNAAAWGVPGGSRSTSLPVKGSNIHSPAVHSSMKLSSSSEHRSIRSPSQERDVTMVPIPEPAPPIPIDHSQVADKKDAAPVEEVFTETVVEVNPRYLPEYTKDLDAFRQFLMKKNSVSLISDEYGHHKLQGSWSTIYRLHEVLQSGKYKRFPKEPNREGMLTTSKDSTNVKDSLVRVILKLPEFSEARLYEEIHKVEKQCKNACKIHLSDNGVVTITSISNEYCQEAKSYLLDLLGVTRVESTDTKVSPQPQHSRQRGTLVHTGPDSSSVKVLHHQDLPGGFKVQICEGDLTTLKVDAVVNAANESLAHGGGVAGAISKAAGYKLNQESRDYIRRRGPLKVGDVVATTAGNMRCGMVIHAVGPMWNTYTDKQLCEQELLYTFVNILDFAEEKKFKTIAIPAVSSGIFGVPKPVVAKAMYDAIHLFDSTTRSKPRSFQSAILITIDPEMNQLLEFTFKKEGRVDTSRFTKITAVDHRNTNSHSPEGAASKPHLQPDADENYLVFPARTNRQAGRTNQPNHGGPRRATHGTDPRPGVDGVNGLKGRDKANSAGPETGGNQDEHMEVDEVDGAVENHDELPNSDDKQNKPENKGFLHDPIKKVTTFINKKLPSGTGTSSREKEDCPICLDVMKKQKTLDECKHSFCQKCIDECFRIQGPKCPICGHFYGVMIGNQPTDGRMNVKKDPYTLLAGYEKYGAYVIEYSFPNGIQRKEHPNPGKPYQGTYRRAYLPGNREGTELLKLLEKAFENRQTFTVGRSNTTGRDGVVVWNDIHHKTSTHGGPQNYGYPDALYMQRLRDELAAKGIK